MVLCHFSLANVRRNVAWPIREPFTPFTHYALRKSYAFSMNADFCHKNAMLYREFMRFFLLNVVYLLLIFF